MSSTPEFQLPPLAGFNRPIDWMETRTFFGHALGDECGYTYTLRELTMMRFLESITDKPDWDKKVFNEEITAKWREEMMNSGKDISPNMIDTIFEELKWRAERYQKVGHVHVLGPGITKSDIAISPETQQALKEAVRPLEDIPEEQKDWHPGSDGKVLDLVHPSLFPVIYGRTRVLTDKTIGIEDCFASIGQGEFTTYPRITGEPLPANLVLEPESDRPRTVNSLYSKQFQWMPCEVKFTDDGGCKITSYINNLHPHKHRGLYGVIEKVLEKTIPLWDWTLQDDNQPHYYTQRIEYSEVTYLKDEVEDPSPEQSDSEDDDAYWQRYAEWSENRAIKLPEPGYFQPPEQPREGWLNLREKFAQNGLQVIVKLANIELTPEKPEYEGGTWHVEGQLNERICATAIYYYDCENVTENTLSFRSAADTSRIEEVSYMQGEHQFLTTIFGFSQDTITYGSGSQITQDIGGVVCREGRLLTFPNTLQHRVSPFSLADRSRPGHRKILAFFLIDPHYRVISSANVAPQQEEWCEEWQESVRQALGTHLPAELQDMVRKNIDMKPMSMEEAKQYRLKLMEERSIKAVYQNDYFAMGGFSLCEH